MLDLIGNLALGFSVSLSWTNLLYCLIGVVVGTAIGVLPGLGPTTTVALLLPVAFRIDPTGSIIMLAGIYYGAMYGGSITSILVKIPGEAASIVTCLDGHEMARQGRAGPALGIAAFGSFLAGVAATFAIAVIGPSLARFALAFGPAEKAMMMLLGLILVCFVSATSPLRSLLMIMVGLLLGTIGLDPITGTPRFNFGSNYLFDGIDIVILAMGLFGIAELLVVARHRDAQAAMLSQPRRWTELLPTREDWRRSAAPIARGSALGFGVGLLPGAGALVASFASYVMEKRLSRRPEQFGRGAIEGLAGPEAANNAASQGSFVPLLCLGIPSSVVTGVLMGALMIHGIPPGPTLPTNHPDLFWGVITSMLIGNLMLVVLNVPMISVFTRLIQIPMRLLAPMIMMFCIVGAYSLNNNALDVLTMILLGIIGFLMRSVRLDPAPLVIAFVLGPLFESSARRALLISGGDPAIFVGSPLAALFVLGIVAALLAPLASRIMRPRRRQALGR